MRARRPSRISQGCPGWTPSRSSRIGPPRPAATRGSCTCAATARATGGSDGTRSGVYRIDVLDRPSLDAVAVCLWARTPRGVEVLLRRQLRPAVLFRRGKVRALPEAEPLLYEEIVAGLVEPGEQGLGRAPPPRRRGGAGGGRRGGRPGPARAAGRAVLHAPRASSRRRSTCSRPRSRAARPAGRSTRRWRGTARPWRRGRCSCGATLDEAIAACDVGRDRGRQVGAGLPPAPRPARELRRRARRTHGHADDGATTHRAPASSGTPWAR